MVFQHYTVVQIHLKNRENNKHNCALINCSNILTSKVQYTPIWATSRFYDRPGGQGPDGAPGALRGVGQHLHTISVTTNVDLWHRHIEACFLTLIIAIVIIWSVRNVVSVQSSECQSKEIQSRAETQHTSWLKLFL